MKFDSAAQILTSISQMQWASQPVQQNRAKVNRMFNGDPPYTDAERKLNRLNTNFNWLEGTRIAANSRYQIYNAFFTPGDFFDIKVDDAPAHKRDLWSRCMTQYINKALRKNRRFRSSLEQAHAQVVLHGPGPILWRKKGSPVPETLGVDDVLVPAGTLADMSNLDYLSIYREWTWGQLHEMTQGDAVDPGWNKDYVTALLKSLYKQPLQPLYQGNRWLFPEKISEDLKENAAMFGSSSLGKVLAWDFYFRDEDSGKWNRRILLDYNNIMPEGLRNEFSVENKRPEFLFEKDDYADDWTEIIHWFTGNCSNVAPFRYYSIRSIGYLLYGVCLVQNTIRCRLADHVLQNLLTWFRNVSEDDRERLEDIQLQHLGIFPDGLSVVGANERYSADWNLIMGSMQQNRQLMAESATSFLPDIAVEGEKPAMTATESLIRNNASVTLTSAVLNQLYNQAEPFYREICRRICLKDKRDPLTKKILEEMKEDEIPESILDADSWDIIPNRVMGGGNKAVELTTARALFEIKGTLGPQGAVEATRKYVLALTNNADELDSLVPETPQISDSRLLAQMAFGTLMDGGAIDQRGTLNEAEYIGTLIEAMAQAMTPLEALQSQPQASSLMADKIAGLVNVGQHIEQHIQILAGDPSEQERVRDAQRLINQLMGQLGAYGQRLAEMEQAQQPQGGLDAETAAKVQSMQIIAQAKAQIATQNATIKQQHKDMGFQSEQQRKDAATVADIRRKDALTQADVTAKDLTTRAELIRQARQGALDRANSKADAAAKKETTTQ